MKCQIATLQYVLAAAETGSFRRAAEMFNIHQSSVSRAIRELEDHLGVSIFERNYSGVRLTAAGQKFLRDAQPAIEQLRYAKRTAEAAGRAEVGVVRIGLLTPLTGGFLRRLVQYYIDNHPEVTIDVHDGGRREHLAAIRAHRLDVAFLTGSEPIQNCETVELWRERVHVALPKGHHLSGLARLDWPQLKQERFIVSRCEPGPEVHDYIVRRAADYSTYPQVEQRAALQDTVMNLVSLGQGITLVSAAWTALKRPGLVLRPLTDQEDVVPFSAVWSPTNDNPALRRFLSVAHVLAGRKRKGSSDWAIKA